MQNSDFKIKALLGVAVFSGLGLLVGISAGDVGTVVLALLVSGWLVLTGSALFHQIKRQPGPQPPSASGNAGHNAANSGTPPPATTQKAPPLRIEVRVPSAEFLRARLLHLEGLLTTMENDRQAGNAVPKLIVEVTEIEVDYLRKLIRVVDHYQANVPGGPRV